MLRYILKRLLIFIPTLLVISLLSFGLSRMAPGDMIQQYLRNDPFGTVSSPATLRSAENVYAVTAQKLNLDKPAFYFSITSAAYPDTLYNIYIKHRRETMRKLTAQYGNWPAVEHWYNGIRSLELKTLALPDSLRRPSPNFLQSLRDLYLAHQEGSITGRLNEMEAVFQKDTLLGAAISTDFFDLKNRFEKMKAEATPGRLNIPVVRWNGLDNQYHTWISGFLRGDFGQSLSQGMTVAKKIKPALFWTLLLNVCAIVLAYLLSVPIGVWSAERRGKRFDKGVSIGLFMLYSLPVFWVSTLALVYFTTPQFGMDFFDTNLNSVPAQAPFFKKTMLAMPHLLLPILCLTYPSLAFVARQMRGSMNEALRQDFVRTARAKGAPERRVVWHHAFRNALFPLITIFASVFPAAIAGSVVVEYIFKIPGMGPLTLTAILTKDWPVVFTVLMLSAILTIVGMLVADLLYAAVDPRVRFDK